MRIAALLLILSSACGRVGFADRTAPPDVRAPIDAPPPDVAPLPDALMLLETMTIPSDGTTIMSTTTLALGHTYTLVASGTYTAVPPDVDPRADAEYYDFDDPDGGPKDKGTTVDLGIGVDDPTDDLTKTPESWGAYRDDHVYTVPFAGKGAPIAVRIEDCCYGDNTGSLTVQIFH
jgi:hypothetical protein